MLKNWLLAIRPKTLLASIGPVLLGSTLAFHDNQFSDFIFLLTLACAVLLQIAVNLANDLFDARSGVDTPARLGPTRVTQTGLISSHQLIVVLTLVCLLASATGLALIYFSSSLLIIFGLASLIAVFAYSAGPWPLASHALGEVMVLLFFGWLAVGGSYYVHTLAVNVNVLIFGTVVGLMSAAIMLVNNIRDIPTDTVANKHTLAVRLGSYRAVFLYKILLISALLIHALNTLSFGLFSFIPLIFTIPFALKLIRTISIRQGNELNIQLAQTSQFVFIYCASMSAVLVYLEIMRV